ncbi:helix-turn-helix domain-containing protein [Variovorax sp. KK3]|uniref:helix-turn-helix domain-containing protein n=1 Tax=Variovorax sp. KK3 TaxID=1855728 RepID=UPI00097C74CA|nr:helix-turn-helix domain-containing protein [Variovorax sp. KK3]
MNPPLCSPHAQRIPYLNFDSRDYAPGEAMGVWQQSLARSWDLSLDDEVSGKPFHAYSDMWHMDRLLVGTGAFGPVQVRTRRERNIRADQLDHYRLILLREGQFDCDAEGRRTALTPGRFVITDMARAETNESCSDSMVMFIPREQLDDALPRPMDLHGLSPDNACSRLLGEHLAALLAQLPEATVEEVPGLSRATVNLVAACIAATPQNVEGARSAVEHVLLRRGRRFIEQQLQDDELGAQALCAHLGVARSTLYRLFEPLGGVSQFIKERRLARIHELLSGGEHQASIASLAEQFGFKSAAHFSKAFRAQYGYSAREVVREAGGLSQVAAGAVRLDRWLGALMH